MKSFANLLLISLFFIACTSPEVETKEHSHSESENPHHDESAHSEGESHHHGGEAKAELKEGELSYPEEKHLTNVRQLTKNGDNAEAYWSFDDKSLVFQARNEAWDAECDQIFVMDPWNETFMGDTAPPLISTGDGRTTCSYFMPGNKTIIYASTHAADKACPPEPPRGDKYVWPIYEGFDIYVSDLEGNIVKQLTNEAGYDAEATLSPQGDKIVFTSTRSGDLELWTMDLEGGDLNQVTTGLGYDGGAFFSPDGTKLIFRASRPQTEEAIKEYKDLLAQGLVQPTEMELYVCNVDGYRSTPDHRSWKCQLGSLLSSKWGEDHLFQ